MCLSPTGKEGVFRFQVVRYQARTGLETRDGEEGSLLRGLGVLFPEDWKEHFPRPCGAQPEGQDGLLDVR